MELYRSTKFKLINLFLDKSLLASCIHASKVIGERNIDSLVELRKYYQEQEVGRLLLTIAATIRNAHDQNPGRAENWLNGINDIVGTLVEDLKQPTITTQLKFREACNKVIHCTAINFDYVETHPRRGNALNPVIYIYGEYRGREWKATLEIDRFVEVAYQVA